MAGKVVGERKCKRATKREVQEWIDKEYGVASNELTRLPLQRFIELHQEEILYGLGPHTAVNYEGHFRLRINPALGSVLLGDLGSVDVERAQMRWDRAGVSYTVQVGTRAALSRVVNHAIKLRAIRENPVLQARKPSKPVETEIDTLSLAEVHQLLEVLSRRQQFYADLAHVSVLTGLRAGELYALRCGDVDPSKGRVTVSRSWSGTGSKRQLLPPKNGKTRHAPWPAELEDILSRHWSRDPRTMLWVGPRGGTPQHANVLSRSRFRDAVKEMGHQDFTWHGLRHTAIVNWIKADIPLTTVRDWAGHSSLKMTDRYAQVARNDHQDGLDALNSYLTRTSASQLERRKTA
ncbi:tyrosine-type recombinase/integrase [Gordonia sihwensis]|uniref:tyrosine-type recombinase/integrase n=1 Tax=Gordonia sihwensis TaxID=173559 RepID=UPI001C93114C|nr:site-specific integrase [Gordonia sihwensis]